MDFHHGRSATINPYRHLVGAVATAPLAPLAAVWQRLAWDIDPRSWSSRKKLRHWKDRYAGEKAVIVCNGPSLLKSDLSLLENVFTFGLNKINLLFDKSDFRPSCIVAVNPHVIDQNREFYNETQTPLFLDSYATSIVPDRPSIAFLHSGGINRFARDCSMSVFQGATVTFVAIQLAFHMGFSRLALIGCDHSFASKGPANLTVKAGEKDNDHFDPNYFAGGVPWQLPDLLQSEVSYTMARSVFELNGRTIVNSTEGGKLEVFERMPLDEFIRAS